MDKNPEWVEIYELGRSNEIPADIGNLARTLASMALYTEAQAVLNLYTSYTQTLGFYMNLASKYPN